MSVLDNLVTEDELRTFEGKYNEAVRNGTITNDITFNYAFCLLRTDNSADIRKAIHLLSDLCRDNVSQRRDYMYFLAEAHFLIKDYKKAYTYINELIRTEPTNQQFKSLKEKIEKYLKKEEIEEAIIKGATTVAVVGGIAAVGFGLMKAFSK